MKNKKEIHLYKQLIGLPLFALLLSVMFAFQSHAAEKTVSFELTKIYDACQFTVTMDHDGYYKVSLIPPKGDPLTTTIENGTICTIAAQKAPTGTWKVYVSDDTDIDIGSVKVSVRAYEDAATSVGNIKIAKDIVGLKYYFADRTFHAEWANSNIGSITITISDPITGRQLTSSRVDSNSYEYEVPEGVTDIIAAFVPSTSASITNAAVQYTIPVGFTPMADIQFEEISVTNGNTFKALITLQDTYGISITDNGVPIETLDGVKAGNYEYGVPLVEGVNDICIWVYNTNGDKKSYTASVNRDSVPPVITLDNIYDATTTELENTVISGTVKGHASLTINDAEVKTEADNTFSYDYPLHIGDNMVLIVATDEAGNTATYSGIITRTEVQEKQFDPFTLIPFLLILIVILVVLIVLHKKKQAKDEEEEEEEATEENSEEDSGEEDDEENDDDKNNNKEDGAAESEPGERKSILDKIIASFKNIPEKFKKKPQQQETGYQNPKIITVKNKKENTETNEED